MNKKFNQTMNKFRLQGRVVIFCMLLTLFFLQKAEALVTARADSLIAAGNSHYMNREYKKAIDCYTRIIGMGYEASSLYYNLGNAYYKQNDLPKAILYYEKARILDPGDEDIRQNLSIANSRIVDKIDSIPSFFLKRWISALAGFFSPDQWALLSLFLFALSLGALFIYIVSHKFGIKKLGFSTGVLLIALSLTGFLLMRNRKHVIQYSRGAIVMTPVVNVKSSPDEQGTNVFTLHEGTHVTMVDSVQQWKEVKIPDGNKGWVPDSVLAGI
jgi:tetratricopeptide (TPR) repeat protein